METWEKICHILAFYGSPKDYFNFIAYKKYAYRHINTMHLQNLIIDFSHSANEYGDLISVLLENLQVIENNKKDSKDTIILLIKNIISIIETIHIFEKNKNFSNKES